MELGVNTFGMGGLLKAPFRRTMERLKENGITGMRSMRRTVRSSERSPITGMRNGAYGAPM